MKGYEFYTIDDKVWYLTEDGRNEVLDESNTEVISMLLDVMMNNYPAAYKALSDYYGRASKNVSYYRFLIARRFCKCNFGKLDTSETDICGEEVRFEKVECPLRGECPLEGIVCMPKFNSVLSSREYDVMELVYKGSDNAAIAEQLFLSPNTVKNHIKSAYAKLGIHEKSEFIRYANKHNMFNN